MSLFSRILPFLLLLVLGCCSSALAYSSVNVPLDDWSYAALDKLEGFGLIHSELHGTRPFSRLEMARLIHEAQEEKKIRPTKLPPLIEELLHDLEREFKQDLELVGKSTDILQKSFIKPVNEIQARYVNVQGQPRLFLNEGANGINQYPGTPAGIKATEGTPLVYNNDGLIYGEHNNFSLQFSSILQYRDFFSAYVEPILLVRQNAGGLQNLDGSQFDDTKVDLLKGYGMLTLWNTQLEVGRDSMWWGQGFHGDMIMTNNAFPLDMVKLSNPEPSLLPWIFRYLGPFKYTVFVSQLVGYETPPNAMLWGFRVNFKPTPLFEMGFSSTILFGGQGQPGFSFLDIFRFFTAQSLPNAHGQAEFDFRYRLPFLWDAQIYMEYGGSDSGGWDPQHPTEIILKDNAWLYGIYFPRLTSDGKADFRVEYATNAFRKDDTPGMAYGHTTYRSGYIHDDMIMGHHMGPDASDIFTRVTYYLTNKLQLGLDYDNMVRGKTLGLVEETANQYGADLTLNLCEHTLSFTTRYAFETVKNYDMQLGDNRQNHLVETVLKLQF